MIKKEVVFTKTSLKGYKRLEQRYKSEIVNVANKLSIDPFDKSLNIKPLTGFDKIYRVVIIKDYRMIYTFYSSRVIILKIAHRKDIYKNLEL